MENPQLQQLQKMSAVYVYSLSQPPEEEALTKITEYAKTNGLTQNKSRLFGRNIYLTDQPEPHGYEYYLTIEGNLKPNSQAIISDVPGGLYAVSEVKDLFNLAIGWKSLFDWIEEKGYVPVGVKKGPYGWVNSAFEELVEWQQQKPPTEWLFRLWIQIKE